MAAPIVPPFTAETARQKVKVAQDLWNTQNPPVIATRGYTPDSVWRNRTTFVKGTADITDFLTKKWQKEKRYKLRKELFAFTDNRIAVQFWYEYYNETEKSWYRCYGLEDWVFRDDGLMEKRHMSGNDLKIDESERWFLDGVDVNTVDISDKRFGVVV